MAIHPHCEILKLVTENVAWRVTIRVYSFAMFRKQHFISHYISYYSYTYSHLIPTYADILPLGGMESSKHGDQYSRYCNWNIQHAWLNVWGCQYYNQICWNTILESDMPMNHLQPIYCLNFTTTLPSGNEP